MKQRIRKVLVDSVTLLSWVGMWLFVFTAASRCSPSVPVGGRSVSVAIVDCIEPQKSAAVAQVVSFGWEVNESGEVTAQCADTGPDGGAGQFSLGSNLVQIDPSKTHSDSQIRQVVGHELVHWLLNHGPHPERGAYHVCTWAFNDPVPPGCYPGGTSSDDMMSPVVGGVTNWSTEVYESDLGTYGVSELDRQFITWGLTP